MNSTINEPVSVVMIYDRFTGQATPRGLRWNGRLYPLTQLGYHHKLRQGNTLCHIFSVVSHLLAFKLRLETEHLSWVLEEVSDGLAD